jgi:hypothetical protein
MRLEYTTSPGSASHDFYGALRLGFWIYGHFWPGADQLASSLSSNWNSSVFASEQHVCWTILPFQLQLLTLTSLLAPKTMKRAIQAQRDPVGEHRSCTIVTDPPRGIVSVVFEELDSRSVTVFFLNHPPFRHIR